MGEFTQDSRSSRHDVNMVRAVVPHYGKLQEIMTISYWTHGRLDMEVFRCLWYTSNLAGDNATLLDDECGFHRLKMTVPRATADPFVFPRHVEQCYYLPYPIPGPEQWSIAIVYRPRSRCTVQEKPNVIVDSSTLEEDVIGSE